MGIIRPFSSGLEAMRRSRAVVGPVTQTPKPIVPSGGPGVPGSGNVTGPASSTDGDFAQYNGTTGKVIKDGGFSSASFDSAGAAAAVLAALTPMVLPAAGATFSRLAKNSTTNYDAGWYGPDVFNVTDYGADRTGVSDSYASIAACIAAGIATGKPFTIYFPSGIFNSSHALPVALASSAQSLTIQGDGVGVTSLVFTDTGTDAGQVITKSPSGGVYNSDPCVGIYDLTYVCSSNAVANAIKISMSGTDAATQGHRIQRVGFMSVANDVSHNWAVALFLDNVASTYISDCAFYRNQKGIFIQGSNGVTSGFKVTNCWFQGGTHGIHVYGIGSIYNRIEGLEVIDCTIILVDYCIRFENSSAGSVLQVVGGDMGAFVSVVYSDSVYAVNITNLGASASGGSTANVIHVLNANGVSVTGCFIGATGGADVVAGVLFNAIFGGTVIGNQFYNFAATDTCIGFDASCVRCIGSLNTRTNATLGVYTDLGTGDVMTGNL